MDSPMSGPDLLFLANQLGALIDAYGRTVHEREPSPAVYGFGLAAVKEEGALVRYDRQAHLNFPVQPGDCIRGRVTEAKLRRLLARAQNYAHRMAGLRQWDAIAWRCRPEWETDRDFERQEDRLVLRFRLSMMDS